MKVLIFKQLLLIITLCGTTVAYSQQQPDSLMQYLEIAAKNNPVVMQRITEYKAALQKVPQVGSFPDPELNVGVFLSPMELVAGSQVADIRLMQMFPWFGVLKNARDEMSLMAKAKYELFRDAKLQLFYDVERTWYEMNKIEQDIQITEKNIEILRTLERLALVKFKAAPVSGNNTSSSGGSNSNNTVQNISSGTSGMQKMGSNSGPNTNTSSSQTTSSMQNNAMGSATGGTGLADLYRIQIDIAELENNIASLKNKKNTVAARFNSYLNRPVRTPITIPETMKSDSLAISLTAISDSMLTNNPMLGMLQFEQQSLEARKRMVTGMGYPMVGLGVNYSLNKKSEMSTSPMNGKDMIMPMVTVTLPIYRNKYTAMQNEAGLLKTANEQDYKATANSLQTEYYEALQLYQDAQRRVKLYEKQNLLIQKTLEITIKSFSASGSGLTDVLRIRQQLLDYQFKQVDALTDNNTAIAWLKRLMADAQIQ
jgi:outer membrane protein TolC